jgi:SAM-dependent methyltransferase
MGWLPPDKYCRWSASILDRAVIFGIDPFFPSLQENPSHLNACAFADRLPFPAATFDFVTANMVLEHIAEPDSLQEVFRVLKPDGFFLLHTPNLRAPQVAISNLLPYSFKRIIVPILEGRQEDDVFQTHYRLNTKETIESVARRLGFQIEWIHYVFNAPLTQVLGPAVIIELLLTRVLTKEHFASWRPDLIGLLRKPAAP